MSNPSPGLIIIHGDNQLSSRELFLKLKSTAVAEDKHLITLSGHTLTLPDLTFSFESDSLFNDSKAIFVEEIFSRRPSSEKSELIKYFLSHLSSPVSIWEPKDVSSQIRDFPSSHIRKFEDPKYVFRFLDSLNLPALHRALEVSPPELVFSLLAGQLHKLIMVKDGTGNFPAWQLSSLKSLSDRFTLEGLIMANDRLLSLDYAQKTSSSPFDLASALELWVLKNVG